MKFKLLIAFINPRTHMRCLIIKSLRQKKLLHYIFFGKEDSYHKIRDAKLEIFFLLLKYLTLQELNVCLLRKCKIPHDEC